MAGNLEREVIPALFVLEYQYNVLYNITKM